SPNGGENWEGGTSNNITWTSTGAIDNVKLEYSINNGSSWNTIIDSIANSGSYNWTVSNSPSTNCLVKISDAAGPASDQSNAVYTIVTERTVTVASPNGGESWEGGTSNNITWTSTGAIDNVKLEYSINNGSSWNTIIDSIANSGSYNWTVPNSPSTNCLVKISDAAGPASDQSNAAFTIGAYRSITVTSPNGGESWEGNTVYSITWNSTGAISNVMIEYSTTSGSSWNTITASTANSGSYNWTVPNTPFNTCLVKISDVTGPASDQSNALFAIVAYRTITVILPNGAEKLLASTIYPITWTNTGNIPNVMIEYSTNSGSSWNTITASTANSGSYNWTIPASASTSCLVRVSDTAGPAVDQSNAVFTISNVTYCTSSGTSQTRGYISRVQVGSLDNSSGSSTYSNFTALNANLTAGSSASVSLTPSGTTYTEYWKIWIDYNRDGDFADSGENVYSGSGKTTKTGSFTVPSATLKGTARMRVSMRSGSNPSNCGSFTYGEVEDYTVNIQ
ncbi:MAG: large repetitive protein, partial [Acidobacteriota bacterium]|nr:large repetitive protein [Acidobacteriota bacterium]